MEAQKKDNRFLIESQPIDWGLALMEFACWKFLAITTAVFAYGTLDQFLSAQLTGPALFIGRLLGVGLFYLMIDAGLTELLRYAFRQQRATTKTKAQKGFTDFIIFLIILKTVATATTSFWAAPEVSEVITAKGKQDEYLGELLARDSIQRQRETEATARLDGITGSESARLKAAREEGNRLVQNAIKTGNRWQRESYRKIGFAWLKNPNNPDGSDKQYVARIEAAQAQAATLVEKERGKAATAEQAVVSVRNDTTYSNTATLLGEMTKKEAEDYDRRKARRTNYIWLLDLIAVVFGILATRLRVLRKVAGGEDEQPKNLPATLSAAWAMWQIQALNYLERILGVDINGDGTIGGTVPAETGDLKQAETVVATTSPAVSTAHTGTKTPIGFRMPEISGISQPETKDLKQAETVVATTSPAVSVSGTNLIVSKQVEEDIEAGISECIRDLQRYFWKWERRGKGGGKPETIRNNFTECLRVIEVLLQQGDISNHLRQKLDELTGRYQKEVREAD